MAEGIDRSLTDPTAGDDAWLAECVGGHLDVAGPVTVERAGGRRAAPHRAASAGPR